MPFVAALHQRGIAEVRDVIADVSLFDRVTIPSTWKVGNLGSDYAVPTDALAYNENVVGIVADHCATPVVITDPSFVPATANVACGGGEPTVRSDAANAITMTGSMPEHFQTLAGIADPALYAAQALRDVLQHAGIRGTGTPQASWERGGRAVAPRHLVDVAGPSRRRGNAAPPPSAVRRPHARQDRQHQWRECTQRHHEHAGWHTPLLLDHHQSQRRRFIRRAERDRCDRD